MTKHYCSLCIWSACILCTLSIIFFFHFSMKFLMCSLKMAQEKRREMWCLTAHLNLVDGWQEENKNGRFSIGWFFTWRTQGDYRSTIHVFCRYITWDSFAYLFFFSCQFVFGTQPNIWNETNNIFREEVSCLTKHMHRKLTRKIHSIPLIIIKRLVFSWPHKHHNLFQRKLRILHNINQEISIKLYKFYFTFSLSWTGRFLTQIGHFLAWFPVPLDLHFFSNFLSLLTPKTFRNYFLKIAFKSTLAKWIYFTKWKIEHPKISSFKIFHIQIVVLRSTEC